MALIGQAIWLATVSIAWGCISVVFKTRKTHDNLAVRLYFVPLSGQNEDHPTVHA